MGEESRGLEKVPRGRGDAIVLFSLHTAAWEDGPLERCKSSTSSHKSSQGLGGESREGGAD